jgi:Tfp pilus assembly protein PilF
VTPPVVPPPPATAGRSTPTASRGAADALVQEATALAKAGKAAQAERTFHRALASDAEHVGALADLAELYFDRGVYPKAVDFGRRGVALAPKRAALRIALGDARFKVSRFTEARAQYQQADTPGYAAAKARIAQVGTQIGG